jgi:hypothetical protein
MQTTSHILMIQPVNFGYNPETAVNNAFQANTQPANRIQQKALEEFNSFVEMLIQNKVDVTVVQDTSTPYTPDSIFPNNWISFHEDDSIVLYPMFAPNRRAERKQHVLDAIREKFKLKKILDLTLYEQQDLFLEGTGSMVLDRNNKLAFACLSPRTNENLLHEFCEIKKYKPVSFHAADEQGNDIYHTNVMMSIAEQYAVICLDSIPDEHQKKQIINSLEYCKKEIIPITYQQLKSFAGNMLQVKSKEGENLLVMSSQAFSSLNKKQVEVLTNYNRIIHSDIRTIETAGGGSTRCMMAEIFSPRL